MLILCLFVKYFFANSNVDWMSAILLLQQWDLPSKRNISLYGCLRKSVKHNA